MSDATLDRLGAVTQRLMALYDLLPVGPRGMHLGDVSRELLKRGIELQGLNLTDALRYVRSMGLIDSDSHGTRWWRREG